MDQLILNDIKSIEKLIMPTKKRIKKHSVCDEYVVFVNRTSTAKYFACALMSMAIKVDSIRVHVVITDSIAEEFIIDFQNEIKANDEINESNPCERIFIYSNIDDYLKKTEYKYEPHDRL